MEERKRIVGKEIAGLGDHHKVGVTVTVIFKPLFQLCWEQLHAFYFVIPGYLWPKPQIGCTSLDLSYSFGHYNLILNSFYSDNKLL